MCFSPESGNCLSLKAATAEGRILERVMRPRPTSSQQRVLALNQALLLLVFLYYVLSNATLLRDALPNEGKHQPS